MQREISELKNHPRFSGGILTDELLLIWDGESKHKTPAECATYRRKWTMEARGEKFAPAKKPLGPPPLCKHRGGSVASPNGKPGWVQCNHTRKPLKTAEDPTGNKVCKCVGCGPKCSGYSIEGAENCLEVTADGIGDHMQGLQMATAWKRENPDQKLAFVPKWWCAEWIELFEGYDLLLRSRPANTNLAGDCSNRGGRHYAEEAATKPRALPWPKPLPAESLRWAEQYRGAVVLCPWGTAQSRFWPHWAYLERLLEDAGRRCVILDGRTDDKTRNRHFRSPVLFDEPAAHIAAVMALSAGVISNESGMAHVAGMLRVPAVVLYAQLDAAPIYQTFPTVRLMRGPLACSGCRFAGKEWRSHCDSVCASLAVIRPENVLAEFREISVPVPGFVADPVADRAIGSLAKQVDSPEWDGGSRNLASMLRFLGSRENPRVLETGCQRQDDDIGAGMFTSIAGRFLQAHGGQLVSVDNDPEHVKFARSRTKALPVEVIESDSVAWLKQSSEPFDLIYLDSHDLTVPGFAEHCLAEARAAVSLLRPGGMLAIDDTFKTGESWNGKGQLAVPWLLAHGFEVVWHGHQTILTTRQAVPLPVPSVSALPEAA